MATFQVSLGQFTFLSLKDNIRLETQASIDIVAGISCTGGSGVDAPTFLDSDVWIIAKPSFSVSLVVSLDESLSFSFSSRRDFMETLGRSIGEAKLWSQLQLEVDDCCSADNSPANSDSPMTLAFTLCRRHSSLENVVPPIGVATFLLCAVNISWMFASPTPVARAPKKRPHSKLGPSLGICSPLSPLSAIFCAQVDKNITQERLFGSQGPIGEASMHPLQNINKRTPAIRKHVTSEAAFIDLFDSTAGDDSEEIEDPIFSSQGSTLFQSQDSFSDADPPSASPIPSSSVAALIDGAFRNLICAKPIRIAPGIRTESSGLRTRLADISPSTFSPGYSEGVAARGPVVPIIARFLTSFLQRARSSSLKMQRSELVQQFSNMQCAENLVLEDEESKLKEVIKTHLWMTMTLGLRDPEAARRLKPLQTIYKLDAVPSDGLIDVEGVPEERDGHVNTPHYDLLEDDHGAWSGPLRCEAGEYDASLDIDEDGEGEEYDYDLFEAYEERLRRQFNLANTGDHWSMFTKHTPTFESDPAPLVPANGLPPSPMLEEQGPSETVLATPPVHILDPSPLTTSPKDDVLTPTRIGSDDTAWSNLLDEIDVAVSADAREFEPILQPSPPPLLDDDDWEPDFEQWEFDVEQGGASDEMLF